MSKHSKKRSKTYQGDDAKRSRPAQPVVHRFEAVERSRLGEWWLERKRFLKPLSIALVIASGGIWLIVELVRLVF